MDAITAFLDAADEVLNSNTFLVAVPLPTGDVLVDTAQFIASGRLQQALLQEDISREWYNFHRLTEAAAPIPIPGSLAKPVFQLTQRPHLYKPDEYLQAMLRGDGRFGSFFSFYARAKTPAEAQRLSAALLTQLFPDLHIGNGKTTADPREPTLVILAPDFFVDAAEGADQIYYFEEKGCDNAALIASGSIGYLILTNGAP
jgi:hypothetical protein